MGFWLLWGRVGVELVDELVVAVGTELLAVGVGAVGAMELLF